MISCNSYIDRYFNLAEFIVIEIINIVKLKHCSLDGISKNIMGVKPVRVLCEHIHKDVYFFNQLSYNVKQIDLNFAFDSSISLQIRCDNISKIATNGKFLKVQIVQIP